MPISRPRKNTSKAGLDSPSVEPDQCPKCGGTDFQRHRNGPKGLYKNVYYYDYECLTEDCPMVYTGWGLRWVKDKYA